MCSGAEPVLAAELFEGAEAFSALDAGMGAYEMAGASEAVGGAGAFAGDALAAGNELYGVGGQLLGGDLAGQSLAAMGYDTVGGMGYDTVGNIAESYTGAPIGTAAAPQYGNFDQAMQGMQEGFQRGSTQALASNPEALQYAGPATGPVTSSVSPASYEPFMPGATPEAAANIASVAPSWLDNMMSGVSGMMEGMPNLGAVGQMASIGSGLYGMSKADQMRQMALDQSRRADPWGQSGGRSQAGAQLQNLLSNPNSITSMPGYEAGLTAVQRKMASQGYQNSGNMMAALQDYGGNFYNNAVTQLGGLAGAGYNPAGAGQLAIQGTSSANDLAGRSMASIGYGTVGNALSRFGRPS